MFDFRRVLFLMIGAALALGFTLAGWLGWQRAIIVAANSFFFVYLAYDIPALWRLSGERLRKVAVRSDVPVYALFMIVVATVSTALAVLFMTINADERPTPVWLIFALLSIPLGWATIHMMAATHYAHLYWRPGPNRAPRGGLDFPGETEPTAMDFIYFSFVIGMTAQTADVSITGRAMRRFALMHSIVAYFFNAVLVAAAVNVAVAAN
ncbi:DUF1345 domain-containing protein [Lysobacter enzymogenes]|uniref:DUF1345 domain-containing protein n=1 Tax=Lysobacter enzymogenes TaxID=69 RepID=A0AAU9B4S4_LYSEN|nr:DUF1345 domain-containing protein [Lysobacter enzymogenes]BAV99691.1 conserved hypothetical protein [Lysobacter enzymogenes]